MWYPENNIPMSFYQKVYESVRRIPRGQVASYGQIASLLGSPWAARAVGWALHRLPEKGSDAVPWQRVVNARGMISTACREHSAALQAHLLAQEGVAVARRKDGVQWVDLRKHLWHY